VIAVISVSGEFSWPLHGTNFGAVLLTTVSRFALFYLVTFPLLSRGDERWGRQWAWLYPLAGLAAMPLGDRLSDWAIRAWLR
jgi:hypothetical protein